MSLKRHVFWMTSVLLVCAGALLGSIEKQPDVSTATPAGWGKVPTPGKTSNFRLTSFGNSRRTYGYDPDGNLFMANDQGIFEESKNSWVLIPGSQKISSVNGFLWNNGILYVSSQMGLFKYDNGTWEKEKALLGTRFLTQNTNGDLIVSAQIPFEERISNGPTPIPTPKYALEELQDGRWQRIDQSLNLRSFKNIYAISFVNGSTLYATEKGIYQETKNSFQKVSTLIAHDLWYTNDKILAATYHGLYSIHPGTPVTETYFANSPP